MNDARTRITVNKDTPGCWCVTLDQRMAKARERGLGVAGELELNLGRHVAAVASGFIAVLRLQRLRALS